MNDSACLRVTRREAHRSHTDSFEARLGGQRPKVVSDLSAIRTLFEEGQFQLPGARTPRILTLESELLLRHVI